MVLNRRRTFFLAVMFFAILMLWQVYYYYVPLYLNQLLIERYGNRNYHDIIGHIMSLDNLAGILIIPVFGFLSDHTKSRLGRRMPYIIIGCALSIVLFPLIAAIYLANSFVWYFIIVVLLVFSMAIFRAPFVSLMPDVTPKPLRTGANAIINFIGYVGAIVGSGITIMFAFSLTNPRSPLTIVPFIITSIALLFAVTLFIIRLRENKLVTEMMPALMEGEKLSNTHHPIMPNEKISLRDKLNFAVIITAVFFCWFAFNALQNFGSLFAVEVLGETENNRWGICTATLAISSLIAFVPSIWYTRLIGRKWAVISGLALAITAMVIAALTITSFNLGLIALFVMAGTGWAVVMVNCYPMFVEISTSNNVGRITGLYYFVSQGAMFLTSNISGYVFKWLSLHAYFWYAIIFMSIALAVCFLYHQNPKPHPTPTAQSN